MNSIAVVRLIFFIIGLSGVQIIIFPGPTVRVAIQSAMFLIIVSLFYAKKDLWLSVIINDFYIVAALIFWGCLSVVRGGWISDSYEQWRYIVTIFIPTVCLPMFILIGSRAYLFTEAIRAIFVFFIPLSLIFIAQGPSDKLSNINFFTYVSFVFPLLVFLPALSIGRGLLIVLLAITSFSFDLTNRSNMGGVLLSVLILALECLPMISGSFGAAIRSYAFRILRYIFLIGPILLLAAGAFGYFNIFEKLGDVETVQLSGSGELALSTVDSRTSIYVDAYSHMMNSGDWIIGSSPAVRYTTFLSYFSEDYIAGRLGGSESSFLGYFMFGGVVYILIVFSLFWRASYLALYCSNSWVIRSIGVYLSVRWAFMFVENPIDFNNYWITTFLFIGASLSPEIRGLSDSDLRDLLFSESENRSRVML